MPAKDELPSTLQRSPKKAQDTWIKTHDSAVEEYGEGARAHRTAYASLKHTHEKVGDHWEPKDKKGPSDPRSEKSTKEKQQGKGKTYGGVDVKGSTKQELLERARDMEIQGRSSMTKDELGEAINKHNQRETAKARK